MNDDNFNIATTTKESDYFTMLKENGIHWLPSTKDKKPALSSYKEYFDQAPSQQEYTSWIKGIENGWNDGIQIICGKVSNGLFTIDFDSKPSLTKTSTL